MAETGTKSAIIGCDLCRTVTYGAYPVAAIKGILKGNLNLPELKPKKEPEDPSKMQKLGLLGQIAQELLYEWRFMKRGAKKYLPKIEELVRERGYQNNTVVLSGRGEERRSITERKLRNAGFLDHFDEIILNKSNGSALSKEYKVEEWLSEGRTVIIFEDDFRTALCEERARQRVLERQGSAGNLFVYVINNPVTNPFYAKPLLRRAGIDELPSSIKLVRGFKSAYKDLQQNLPDLRQVA